MFETVAVVVFWFFFCIWSNDGWFNLFLKASFLAMALWGSLEAAQHWGYVIKANHLDSAQ